jgi:hypothetical protein
MVLGGIIIPQDNLDTFNLTMQKFRNEQNMHAELKWSKVSDGKLNEYKVFVDYFFALNNTNRIHFACLVIDTTQLNHKKYSGDKETGFYKFYYQLLLHCFAAGYLSETNDVRFIIHLDYRNSKYKLSDLKDILNNGIKKKMKITTNRVISLEAVDSKKTEVLQVADIVLGAIGFVKNGYDLIIGSKQSKINLSQYISKGANSDLKANTAYGITRFKIWNFKFSKR